MSGPIKTKGFTLIELAVVIAIIAILAAVALPRIGDASSQAECAKVRDLAARLSSAASIYTAEQSQEPIDFSSFVTGAEAIVPPQTLSIHGFDCGTIGATIGNCAALRDYNPTYLWRDGQVSLEKPVPKKQADAPDCN